MVRVSAILYGVLVAVSPWGCRGMGTNSQVQDTVPVDPEERASSLGGGYDSLAQTIMGRPACVAGESQTENAGRSDVSLSQAANVETVMKEFTGEVKGTPRALFVNSAAAGFYRSINSSDSALDLVYTARILQSSERLTGVSLKPELKDLTPVQILEQCGDEYVGQLNRGGTLTINLKFQFGSVQNRMKWQSLISFTGPLRDLSSDLKKKLEKSTVDGTLTVSVTQVGGSPNQALMNVKTCSMSSAADLEACQKLVDDVMTYANQSFPAQVQSAPAILNYVTVPLRTLGVRGLPEIDPKVLQTRKELEILLKDYAHLKSQGDLARAMNLPYDGRLAGDIDFNQSVIKDTARACYTHEITENSLSWQRCFDRSEKMAATLRRVERRRALVERLVVSSANELGGVLVNDSSEKMNIAYAVDPKALWSNGSSRNVAPSDGVDASTGQREACSSSCLLPATNKGTLVLQQGTGLGVSGTSGTLDIYPGEAVLFVMNDERGKFSDNKGAITIYWRCSNCVDDTKVRPTTRLTVPANQEAGIPFKNRTSTPAKYSVMAYGQWANGSSYAWTDARGSQSDCGPTCPAPTAKDQVLVAKRSGSLSDVVGKDGQISMEPGETVSFVTNDDRGGYRDNRGALELILQCLTCP